MKNKPICYLNKKKIIVGLIIMFITLLLILYIKTDFLKTKEQLFWKYMVKEADSISHILSNDEIEKFGENLKKSGYSKEGTVSISSKYGFVKPIDLVINEKGNNVSKVSNVNLKFTYNKENLLDLSVINDNNYFIVNSNKLGINNIGLDNANLKKVAQKIGIENDTLVPNEIKEVDFFELFSINENEKNHILKKYIPLIRKNVNGKNYSKEKDSNNNEQIMLNITYKEAKDVLMDILSNIYNDEKCLNIINKKLQILNFDKDICNIDNIKFRIKELINKIQEINDSENEFISIIIYKKEKNVEKIELIIKDNRKITISVDEYNNNIYIKQSNVKGKTIDIDNLSNIVMTILNSISEISYTKDVINDNKCQMNFNVICNFGIEQVILRYNYIEKMEDNVENLLNKEDVEYIDIKNLSNNYLNYIYNNRLKSTIFNIF